MSHGLFRAPTILLATTLGASACIDNTIDTSTQTSDVTVSSSMVLTWNENSMIAIATSQIATGGARQARAAAMAQAAVHDALNAISHRYQSYGPHFRAPRGASADAAVAAAAHDVLLHEFPYEQATLDAKYAASLATIADGQSKSDGIAAGQTAAANIVALRANDNSAPNASYTFGPPDPGVYQPTPPAFLPPVEPHWAEVTPFVIRSADQFRPGGPYPVDSLEYAIDYNEVKLLGQNTSLFRTQDQSEASRFWLESSPFTWNRIARTIAATRPQDDAWVTAHTLALVDLAMADAFIAGFDSKYLRNFWRPVTGVRAGDTDGNPLTIGDPTWLPYGLPATPRHPDYVSTHSISGGAAAAVLIGAYGDNTPFTITTPNAVNGPRTYSNFTAAANENSNSRVWACFHFRKACSDGQAAGGDLGSFIAHHAIRGGDDDDNQGDN